jgi:predicted nucleotidyltransferase
VTRLPEKVRKTLEKIVKDMRIRENIYGVGLFGSWSRGDAVPSSDVDLLVLDASDFNYEYVERKEIKGLFIDLNHVPKRWIRGCIPPEVDQKLYEMQILYDRDWSLTNTKLLMVRHYGSPERIAIRTEAHVVESDIYLSRSTSAFSREDFRSARLFATVALENVMKILTEIALEPVSNSRFVETLERSARKLEMQNLFDEYLRMTGLVRAENTSVERRLKLFKQIWDEANVTVKRNFSALESSHFKVKTKLKYYLNPAFLQGVILRTKSLINTGKMIEAAHYLNDILLDIIENYLWLKSSIQKMKLDLTTMICSLENLEEKTPQNYEHILEFLDLKNVNRHDAADEIEETREIMVKIRRERKPLIQNHLLKDQLKF